jgi:hypothetical protein
MGMTWCCGYRPGDRFGPFRGEGVGARQPMSESRPLVAGGCWSVLILVPRSRDSSTLALRGDGREGCRRYRIEVRLRGGRCGGVGVGQFDWDEPCGDSTLFVMGCRVILSAMVMYT